MTRFRPSLRPAVPTQPVLASRPFDLLCITMGFVMLVHAVHLPWWLTASLVVVLAARWLQRRRGGRNAPIWVKLPLIGLLLAVVVHTYGTLFGREPGTAFAVGLLVLKLLESEHTRDARVGVAFASFALMSALLFDQSIVATLIVACGIVPAMMTLRSLEEAVPARASLGKEALPVLLAVLVSIPLALFAFLFVPRLSTPLWGAPAPDKGTTGLSDRMAPGEMSELLTDDSVAMRVTFDGAPPAADSRYFRAFTMSHFDGNAWSPDFRPDHGPAALEGHPTFRYRVTMEPTHQRNVPLLDMPLSAPDDTRLRGDRTALAQQRIEKVYNYEATAAAAYRLEPALDDRTRQANLQLPANIGPRARAQAQAWSTALHGDPAGIARAALAMFHEGGFRYTLAPAPLGRDRIDDFLFETREGYCEHYASSFTFLMRAAGLPARVVTGYHGGYWNRLGDYLLVRHANAHAWSEVWIDGRGWVRFDPTGAVRPDRVSRDGGTAAGGDDGETLFNSAWWENLRDRWDVVNQWWNQAVNGFDALRQQGLLQPFGIRRADVGDLAVVLAAGCGVLVAAALGWAMFQRREGDALDAWMRRLQRKLARAGVTRRTGEGPKHFFHRAARALPGERNALERLSEVYLRSRYAFDEPPPESVSEFSRYVKEFKPRRVVK